MNFNLFLQYVLISAHFLVVLDAAGDDGKRKVSSESSAMMEISKIPPPTTSAGPPQIPTHFTVHQKWPECGGVFDVVPYQDLCNNCAAITVASVLSDRFCVRRLELVRRAVAKVKTKIGEWMVEQKERHTAVITFPSLSELLDDLSEEEEMQQFLAETIAPQWEDLQAKIPGILEQPTSSESADGIVNQQTLAEHFHAGVLVAFAARATRTNPANFASAIELTSCVNFVPWVNPCNGKIYGPSLYRYAMRHGVTNGTAFKQLGCNPYPKDFTNNKTGARLKGVPPKCADIQNGCWNKEWTEGAKRSFKVKEMRRIKPRKWRDYKQTAESMQREILERGPISVGIFVYRKRWFNHRGDGIFNCSQVIYDIVGHKVRLIGWGEQQDENGKIVLFWRAMNTYGQGWGDNGQVKILRGVNACGVEAQNHVDDAPIF